MRILLVNTRHYHGGGDSIYTLRLADLLRSKGHQCAFFAMQDSRNIPDRNSDLFVTHIDFRKINRERSVKDALRVLLRAIYSREARLKFSQLVDRFNPDLVHLHNLHAHITPSVILEAKRRKLPVVWTLHDYKLVCPNSHFLVDRTGQICEACGRGRFYQPLLRRCKKGSLAASAVASLEIFAHRLMRVNRRVDVFIAPSQFLRRKFLDRGFPASRVAHLPYFLPENAFQPVSTENKALEQPYFLFLGKVELVKGVRELVAACRLKPHVRVLLAGRPDEAGVQALLDKPQNIECVGFKQRAEVESLLRGALALVLPSIWYENQPICILEAFASGKPVIASNLGGMAELVGDDRERGVLVPPCDPRSLGEALEWMVGHPEVAAQMGRNAYGYAQAEFHAERHYERLVLLYQSLFRVGSQVHAAQ